MRLVSGGYIFLSALISSALAATIPSIPIDPHLTAATGGDAMSLTGETSIQLSQEGGGIFVFKNLTGSDLAEIDVVIPVLSPFSVGVTTFPLAASSGFMVTFPIDCPAEEPTSASCLKLQLFLAPGTPLGANGTNFVLDFDKFPGTTVDQQVASGQYTGETVVEGQVGDWIAGVTADVIPVTVPEPGSAVALLLGGAGLAIYRRRRNKSSI